MDDDAREQIANLDDDQLMNEVEDAYYDSITAGKEIDEDVANYYEAVIDEASDRGLLDNGSEDDD